MSYGKIVKNGKDFFHFLSVPTTKIKKLTKEDRIFY